MLAVRRDIVSQEILQSLQEPCLKSAREKRWHRHSCLCRMAWPSAVKQQSPIRHPQGAIQSGVIPSFLFILYLSLSSGTGWEKEKR
ncbi:hypothetical protein OH491_12040 [Termitidicoccus mucosus]|uniref:hypothetical protein n=1 Tax=Termitidicoccus mucosus TaxID=1184151 RepID=UPI0011AB7FE3